MSQEITKERIVKISERACKAIYRELISTTNVERVIAFSVAKDAADALGNSLLRDLPEHGVKVLT